MIVPDMQAPTEDERRTARIILQHVDTDSLAVLTGESARVLQPLVHLPANILGKIWNIIDQDGTGFLTLNQLTQFVRLIGYAQTNEPLTRSLLRKAGPECRIDGWTHKSDYKWEKPAIEIEAQLVQAIMKENDKEGYGVLDGDTAKAVMRRSGLPNETLGEIWEIVDDPPKGFMVDTDLRRALRLISCAQRGMKLHRRLYENPCPLPDLDDSFVSPEVATPPPPPPLPTRTSISSPITTNPPPMPIAQPFAPKSVQLMVPRYLPQRPPNDPLPELTPSERKTFIGIFSRSNPIPHALGEPVITGAQAIEIFSRSKLPTSTLGQVWDLADSDQAGMLTRGKFVVAMYLIKGLMDKRFITLPQVLPPWLVIEASKDEEGKLPQKDTYPFPSPSPSSPHDILGPPHAMPDGTLGIASATFAYPPHLRPYPSPLNGQPVQPGFGPQVPFKPQSNFGIQATLGSASAIGHARSQSQPPAAAPQPQIDLLDLENELAPVPPPKAASDEEIRSLNTGTLGVSGGGRLGGGGSSSTLGTLRGPGVNGGGPSGNRPDPLRESSSSDYLNRIAPAHGGEELPPYSEMAPGQTMRV